VSSPEAPGRPGIEPRWTSAAKSGVGTSATSRSRVWFTLSHGIVNEVYYPRVDQANTRDLGLVVTAPDGFFSEEKRPAAHEVTLLGPGVPGYRLTNRCLRDRYRIAKTVVTDPERDVLLQQIGFDPPPCAAASFWVFAIMAPHLGNQGYGNNGWVGSYKGDRMLFAARGPLALALACSVPFADMSCGYVGVSDGWQDLAAHGRLIQSHQAASDGNIGLTASWPLRLLPTAACSPSASGARGPKPLRTPVPRCWSRSTGSWPRMSRDGTGSSRVASR